MRHHALAVVKVPAVSRRERGGLRFAPILCLGLILATVLALASAAIPTPVYASTSGPLMAGTGSDVDGPGSRVWAYPENITADDTNYATVEVTQGGFLGYYHTHYLCGTDFGFNVPSGSTIDGIQVTIARMMSGPPNGIHDDELYLIKGGSIGGEDKSTEDEWPNMVIGEATYGATDNCWGLSWTPADINAANFGVALCVYNSSWVTPYTAYVDYMLVTVTYTLPGTTTTIVTSGTPSTYGDSVTFTATVTALAGTNTPSGTVTFKEGGTTLGTGTLAGSGGVATAAYSTTTLSAGTHTNITAVYAGDSNFTGSTSSSISQTVNARPLTITASNGSKTYGDTLTFAGTEFTTSGLANSDAVTSVTLSSTGTGPAAAAGTYSIVPSAAVGTGLSNYSISYANGTLTVNQKALTITASNRSKTYGDIVSFAGTEFTTSGLVNTDAVTSVTLASSGTVSAAAVGTYSIVPSAAVGTGLANYSISYANGTLTVNQKALTVTADARSKSYGDTVSFAGTEFTPEGLVNSDSVTSVSLSSSGASAAATVAGSPYSIVPSAAIGTGLSNYSISYVNGSLSVGLKALTVNAGSRSKTYGDTVTFNGTEFTASGLVNSDTVTSATLTSAGADASAAIGAYPIVPSAALGTGLSNYSITYANGTMTVSAKALTITAAGVNRVYDGTTTATVTLSTDAVGGDDVTASYTAASFADKNAGSGKTVSITGISISGADAGNYDLLDTTASTTADISQKALTITAAANTKTYDGDDSAAAMPTVSGLEGSDTASDLSETYDNRNAGPGKTLSVATYTVNDGNGGHNYSVNLVTNTTGVINQRDLTVTATGVEKVYDGTTTAAVTLTTDALGGDNVTASCTGASFADKNAGSGKAVSVTGISISGADAGNYNLLDTTASTTAGITQKALTITAADGSKTYGDALTMAGTEFTVIGLEAGDSVDSVTLTSTGADAPAAAGAYDITPGAAVGSGLENYSISYVNGTLAVNKASLTWTVTSSSEPSAQGDAVTFTATVNDAEATGTVTFRDGDVVLGTGTLSHGVATLTVYDLPAGSHSVTISYDGDPNFADGTSSAYIWQVSPASRSSWWLIACVAAGVMAGILCLLFFIWRRRRRQQPPAANVSSSGARAAAADAVAGNMAPAAVAGAGAPDIAPDREPGGGQEKAEYSTEAALQSIWSMVETENPDVAAHQKRVSQLACAIAVEMGLSDRQIDGIRLASELHDIGKVIEPAETGNEPGNPSEVDNLTRRDHPKVAFDILNNLEFEGPVARIVAQHHERLDGSGYPYGVSGEDILPEARILAVADVVDEMLTTRPDRPAPGLDAALAELADGDGSRYDSGVVRTFQKLFGKSGSETELVNTHP